MKFHKSKLTLTAIPLTLALALGGCFDNSDDDDEEEVEIDPVSLDMGLPVSLTGAVQTSTGTQSTAGFGRLMSTSTEDGLGCHVGGNDNSDPFQNGYTMTKFMVSNVQAWTCVADVLSQVASILPSNGEIIEADDNQVDDPNYDPGAPTHFSVDTLDDGTVELRLYYGESTTPTKEDASFYLGWSVADSGSTTGRLVVLADAIDPDNEDPEGVNQFRLDFALSDSTRESDMFIQFKDASWAEGLRIFITKDLTADSSELVFTARGMMEMNRQWADNTPAGVPAPDLRMFTVSNEAGDGAAYAEFGDIYLPFPIDATSTASLGNYLSDKADYYYFDKLGTDEYIYKTFENSNLESGRNLTSNLETYFETELSLGSGYFTSTCTDPATDTSDCNLLINNLFSTIDTDGNALVPVELNSGDLPTDWRATAIEPATSGNQFLDSIYPNSVDWTGAFDFEI